MRRLLSRAARWALWPVNQSGRFLADARHRVTPIKQLIIIIGENRSFDHVFATYITRRSPGIRS